MMRSSALSLALGYVALESRADPVRRAALVRLAR